MRLVRGVQRGRSEHHRFHVGMLEARPRGTPVNELTEFRRDAIEECDRPPTAGQYEAICEFFGWPSARRIDAKSAP